MPPYYYHAQKWMSIGAQHRICLYWPCRIFPELDFLFVLYYFFVNVQQLLGKMSCGAGQEVQIFKCPHYVVFSTLQAGILKFPLKRHRSIHYLIRVWMLRAAGLWGSQWIYACSLQNFWKSPMSAATFSFSATQMPGERKELKDGRKREREKIYLFFLNVAALWPMAEMSRSPALF